MQPTGDVIKFSVKKNFLVIIWVERRLLKCQKIQPERCAINCLIIAQKLFACATCLGVTCATWSRNIDAATTARATYARVYKRTNEKCADKLLSYILGNIDG